jgi:UDPglucose 6-dehydrogenase
LEIAIAGAGHVGLVSAAALAAIGHRVRAYDVDIARIERLSAGEAPFFEPGLPELLDRVSGSGALTFHTDPADAVPGAALIFLCINTPNAPEGHVDISSLVAAAQAVVRHAGDGAIIVNRSTAPVGTAAFIRSMAEESHGDGVRVAINPEFLAEGAALRDFLSPDRLVVGVWEEETGRTILEAYEPIIARRLPRGAADTVLARGGEHAGSVPVVITDPQTAELIKYAANAFLALKISFINEMAAISDELGADVTELARAVGLDRRIGPDFLRAGIGWGGSCFPKDIAALQGMAETRGLPARLLRAANEVNLEQHNWVIRKLQLHLKTLVGRRVAFLGLAFKPNTDDLRDAPALEIAGELARMNVRVRAFDPAIKSLPPEFDGIVELADSPVSAAEGAEVLVLVTEWPEFGSLDLSEIRGVMRDSLLLDGRNFFDPAAARSAGFTYVGVGR